MNSILRRPSKSTGFSLLEVMIAVVVLATGLLALAALQGSLTRSSADAKVRARISALLSARMDALRSLGYYDPALNATATPTPVTTCTGGVPTWLCVAQKEANLGALSLTQAVTPYSSAVGAGTFNPVAPTDPANDPQFKRVVLTAQWTDADSSAHALALTSDFSALALSSGLLPSPNGNPSTSVAPIVREDDPGTAGVIPIALGNGDSTAASNPTPERLEAQGQQTGKLVGTGFTVLTYTPAGDQTIIQKRFENQVIKCSCKYGAPLDPRFSALIPAQWPAVWTGERYDVYLPTTEGAPAPGVALSAGPDPAVADQSPLCQECCRDHHDPGGTTDGRFDPERSDGSVDKFKSNGSSLVEVPYQANSTYIDACRIIRVDGLWRTASDMYSRQYGLLETQSDPRASALAGDRAKSGLPTDSTDGTPNATDLYTSFVKDYVEGYETTIGAGVGTAPTDAQTKFNAITELDLPATVLIATQDANDKRYLHGRGLYIDYLEAEARQKLTDVLADTGVGGACQQTSPAKPIADCILPYLPFTTINLTELVQWATSSGNNNVIFVNSQNDLGTIPDQPSGGRTNSTGPGKDTNVSTTRLSNSGVAASEDIPGGVDDPDDIATVSDSQDFQVEGVLSTGDRFQALITGGNANPYVYYTIPSSLPVDSGECGAAGPTVPHTCPTNTLLIGQGGSIRVENYNTEAPVDTAFNLADIGVGTPPICTGYDAGYNANGQTQVTLSVPTFTNYAVTAASINVTTPATSFDPVVLDNKKIPDATQPKGFRYESTTANFANISAGDMVNITLEYQGTSTATLASCVMSHASGNKKAWVVSNIVWTKPWETP